MFEMQESCLSLVQKNSKLGAWKRRCQSKQTLRAEGEELGAAPEAAFPN